MTEPNGVLRVDKPEGPTSHDVVARARRALRTRRIGHTGTLDPFASGLLVLCVGQATRLAEYLTGLPKSYLATLRLGETTDTDDRQGEVVSRSEGWRDLGEEAVRAALAGQAGTLQQLPPVYSAKKVGGERMYAVARRGGEVERHPVEVTVHRIELLRFEPPRVEFAVDCSSGTYIRAIARDVGAALGVGAHLTALRRTRVGEHPVDGALSLESLDDADAVARAMLAPADAVAHLPRMVVAEADRRRLSHGGALSAPEGLPEGVPVALLSEDRALLAVGERSGATIRPRKVLA